MTPILTGWNPNPRGTEAWLNDPANVHPVFGLAAAPLIAADESTDTVILMDYVLKVFPGWRRINQGIGDCVSHGFELGATILMAIQSIKQRRKWMGVAASEPIYGGSRVEARGVKSGGWSDGSYGAAAAKWLQQWGVLVRSDYSAETGNGEHNLTAYDARKAKQWGNYGCGGRSDKDTLDTVARLHPVKTTSLVTTFEEAGAAIHNGYPVPVCSNVGFASRQNNKGQYLRDDQGFIRPRGSWSHCMCFAGVRHGTRPGLLCVNSWGSRNAGPRYPAMLHEAIAECSFWVDADVCNSMLGRWKDSFALSQFVGFKKQTLPDLGFSFG